MLKFPLHTPLKLKSQFKIFRLTSAPEQKVGVSCQFFFSGAEV